MKLLHKKTKRPENEDRLQILFMLLKKEIPQEKWSVYLSSIFSKILISDHSHLLPVKIVKTSNQ